MLTKNINKLPKSVAEVDVKVPWLDIAPLWDQTIEQQNQLLDIPGFRKGQAPAEMVEQRAGAQLQQEFLKVAMPQSLMTALQGTDVLPIDFPNYTNIIFQKGQDLSFKATITTRPQVAVGSYKTIKVQRPAQKQITDSDVEKVITDLFTRWKARTPASPAGGPQTPTGQSTPEVPTDDFAKGVGAQSLMDLRTKIKTDLEADAKYNNELDYEEAILQEIEKMTQVDVPEILIQDELNRMLVSLQRRVTDMGMLFEDYLKSQNKTMDSIKAEWRVQAEKNVRMELGLAEVARLENVNITDQELQDEIGKIQDGRLKAQFEAQEPRMHLRHALRQTKTLNLLKGLVGIA